MKRNVVLSIRGTQRYAGQEPETIELVTGGTMEYTGGAWHISYEESAVTGMEGVTTTFRVEPEKVTLTRRGNLNSQMVFQEGVRHDSLYQMELGALMLTIQASRIEYDLTPEGGSIDLTYHINIENTEAGEIDYHLDIRARE